MTKLNKLAILFAVATVGVAMTSCRYTDPDDSDMPQIKTCTMVCDTDNYCSEVENKCVPKKEANAECEGSEECLAGFCYEGVCTCSATVKCPGELFCFSNVSGYSTCREKKKINEACTTDSECGSGSCVENKCFGCASNRDCGENQVCEAPTCRNIITCPNNSEKMCFLSLSLTPTLNWFAGNLNDGNIIDGDFLGKTFTPILPQHDLDVCISPIVEFAMFADSMIGENGRANDLLNPQTWETMDSETYKKTLSSMLEILTTTNDFIQKSEYAKDIIKMYGYDLTPYSQLTNLTDPNVQKLFNVVMAKENFLAQKNDFDIKGCAQNINTAAAAGTNPDITPCQGLLLTVNTALAKIFRDPYLLAREEARCIQATMETSIPFTIQFNQTSAWKEHNFYVQMKIDKSPLMADTDQFVMSMAPAYNALSQSTFTDKVAFSGAVEQTEENKTWKYLSTRYEYNKCSQATMNLTDLAPYGITGCSDGIHQIEFRADYQAMAGSFMTCNDRYTRIGDCPKGDITVTVDKHAATASCGKEDLAKLKKEGKFLNCTPSVSVLLDKLQIFVELNDSDIIK